MIIKSLKIKNFKDTPQAYVELPSKGITLIHGDTGVGKSSLLEAVFFVIFIEAKTENKDFWLNQPVGTTLNPEITIEFEHQKIKHKLEKIFARDSKASTTYWTFNDINNQYREIHTGKNAHDEVKKIFDEGRNRKNNKAFTSLNQITGFADGDLVRAGLFRIFYKLQRDSKLVEITNKSTSTYVTDTVKNLKGEVLLSDTENKLGQRLLKELQEHLTPSLEGLKINSTIKKKAEELDRLKDQIRDVIEANKEIKNLNYEFEDNKNKVLNLESQLKNLDTKESVYDLKDKNRKKLEEEQEKLEKLKEEQETLKNYLGALSRSKKAKKNVLKTINENKTKLSNLLGSLNLPEKKEKLKDEDYKNFKEKFQNQANDFQKSLNFIDARETIKKEEERKKKRKELEEKLSKSKLKIEQFKNDNSIGKLPTEDDRNYWTNLLAQSIKIKFELKKDYLPVLKLDSKGNKNKLESNQDNTSKSSKYEITGIGNINLEIPKLNDENQTEKFEFEGIKNFEYFYKESKKLMTEEKQLSSELEKFDLLNPEKNVSEENLIQDSINQTMINNIVDKYTREQIEGLSQKSSSDLLNITNAEDIKDRLQNYSITPFEETIKNNNKQIKTLCDKQKISLEGDVNDLENFIIPDNLNLKFQSKIDELEKIYNKEFKNYEDKFGNLEPTSGESRESLDEKKRELEDANISIKTLIGNKEATLPEETIKILEENLEIDEDNFKHLCQDLYAKKLLYDVYREEALSYEGNIAPHIKEIMDVWLGEIFQINGKPLMSMILTPQGGISGIYRNDLKGPILFQSFSEGQTAVIGTLWRLAIAKIINEERKEKYTQILDDPLANVDEDKIISILSIIEKLSKDYPIVINAVNNSLINYYDDISDIQKISFESIL